MKRTTITSLLCSMLLAGSVASDASAAFFGNLGNYWNSPTFSQKLGLLAGISAFTGLLATSCYWYWKRYKLKSFMRESDALVETFKEKLPDVCCPWKNIATNATTAYYTGVTYTEGDSLCRRHMLAVSPTQKLIVYMRTEPEERETNIPPHTQVGPNEKAKVEKGIHFATKHISYEDNENTAQTNAAASLPDHVQTRLESMHKDLWLLMAFEHTKSQRYSLALHELTFDLPFREMASKPVLEYLEQLGYQNTKLSSDGDLTHVFNPRETLKFGFRSSTTLAADSIGTTISHIAKYAKWNGLILTHNPTVS